MTDEKITALWAKAAAFHGHECPGLTIGFKAALLAIELLNLSFSDDEQVVCIAENDACGVDAIQVLLGCSAGKGNLLFHLTGKQAFSIYERNSGRSVRLVLNPPSEEEKNMSREERMAYLHSRPARELFSAGPTRIALPERARHFASFPCAVCGEICASHWMRLKGEEKVCLDCYEDYNRFSV